ncbi:MAG: hypothetical protein HPY66_0601 [Firmicutes bacterium]|nr:hypothetical protein [Bacillota bacterium]
MCYILPTTAKLTSVNLSICLIDSPLFFNSLKEIEYEIYAYCLMENHIHLPIKANTVNTAFALEMFHKDRGKAIKEFCKFNTELNNDICLEVVQERKTMSDKDIGHLILKEYNIELATEGECLMILRQLAPCSPKSGGRSVIGSRSSLTAVSDQVRMYLKPWPWGQMPS